MNSLFSTNSFFSTKKSDQPPPARRGHLPWIQSPIIEDESEGQLSSRNRIDAVPKFRQYADSNTIELLYDLFFVANLSNFTALHGVEDVKSLQNYIGFFTILWFTYLQTTLKDVRFGADSVFDRVCKAITFGVMAGFAMGGALYDTQDVTKNSKGFRVLFIALMVSRLTLLVQYGVVLWYIRGYKKTFLPLALTMGAMGMSSVIFLGVFFNHYGRGSENGHVAAYVVSAVEAILILAISCVWRVVSFKNTRFVDRLGSVTLIMLGEGVLGLVISISKIMQNSAHVSGAMGVTAGGVLLIYFMWMLYFDQIELNRFGTIRQQIWAILHYPLNLAMILVVEGNRELIAYNTIVGVDRRFFSWEPDVQGTGEFGELYDLRPWESGQEYADYLRLAVADFGDSVLNNKLDTTMNLTKNYELFETADPWEMEMGSEGQMVVSAFTHAFFASVENYILSHFGVTAPDSPSLYNMTTLGDLDPQIAELINNDPEIGNFLLIAANAGGRNTSLFRVFETVYWYFPIASGVFLVMLAVMYAFGKRNKHAAEYWSIALRASVGVILAAAYGPLVYFIDEEWYFKDSVWPIPIVALSYFVVIVGDNMLVYWGNKRHDDTRGLVPRIRAESQYRNLESRGDLNKDVEMVPVQAAKQEHVYY